MQPIPPITSVAEIVLSVANLPEMRDFYSQVMGFAIHSESSLEDSIADPVGHPTITFLTICETETPLGRGGHPQMLALIDHKRHIYARERLVGHDVSKSTLNHLAFEIPPESYDAHVNRLNELGIALTFSDFPAVNAKAMFFKDPEGNMLELICHQASQ